MSLEISSSGDLFRILSSDMYDTLLKERGPNLDLYLSYAIHLSGTGKISDTLEVLLHTYRLYNMTTDKISQIVGKLVDYLRTEARDNGNLTSTRNVFSCPSCLGVLCDPITLPCGHTYCRRCLLRDNLKTCKVCQTKLRGFEVDKVKHNVVVGSLVQRWWRGDVQGVQLRTQGNKLVKEKQLGKALEVYTEAAILAPSDHLLLSNRSHILHVLGRSKEALTDAEAAIRCRPDWAKGYYRRAAAQQSLGHHEDTVVSYMVCAVLEDSIGLSSIKGELSKALHWLFSWHTQGRKGSLPLMNKIHSAFPSRDVSGSCVSLPLSTDNSDDEGAISDEGSDTGIKRHYPRFYSPCSSSHTTVEEVPMLRRIIDKYHLEVEKVKKSTPEYERQADPNNFNKDDVECALCFRYLYQPVTTPCGHSFCRNCLDRCLDHSTNCPLCKTSLREYLAERRSAVTEFLDVAMQTVMRGDYDERQFIHERELDELAAAGKDAEHEIPIFVATLAIPTISCPLHVFEPRYRLMIRRCMESGTREFGMCMPKEECESGYANYGTMLEIRDVEYTPDGRSIVNTVGGRRFKIKTKSVKDGYNTATVEFLEDAKISESNLSEFKKLHDKVHQQASKWFEQIESLTKRRIISHYGNMPPLEVDYCTLKNGPAWTWWIVAILPLDSRIQLSILQEIMLKRRLGIIQRILCYIMEQQQSRRGNALPQT
ncbi:unnamed protein product, partial [Meganyctiphanes norvegica]